jgi:hypothetical protein
MPRRCNRCEAISVYGSRTREAARLSTRREPHSLHDSLQDGREIFYRLDRQLEQRGILVGVVRVVMGEAVRDRPKPLPLLTDFQTASSSRVASWLPASGSLSSRKAMACLR